jgi:hypothetical protein
MKAWRKSIYTTALGSFLVFVFGVAPAGAIPMVSIQPSSLTPGPGSILGVSVGISSVVDLYAFQFDITFNPLVLLARGVCEGPFLPGGGFTFFLPGSMDNEAGMILVTMNALLGAGGGVNGSGVLAHLEFEVLAEATSPIILSNVVLFDSTASAISFGTIDGMISSVPEPSTLFLVVFPGILFVGFIAKYQNQSPIPI